MHNLRDTAGRFIPSFGTTKLALGWTEGLPMRTYLRDLAISSSQLWAFNSTTPAHFLEALRARGTDRRTKALDLGHLVHTAVFEPDEFGRRYLVLGRCAKEGCTNPGKRYRRGRSYCGVRGHDPKPNLNDVPRGRYAVSQDLRDKARAMAKSLHSHPTAGELLARDGPREVTGVAPDPDSRLWLRIRPDLVIAAPSSSPARYHHSAVNLKSTGKSAHPEQFPREFVKAGHYFRAAFYRVVMEEIGETYPQHFFFPVVETAPPYAVIVYRLHDDVLDVGESEVRAALNRLAICRDSGEWPAYGPLVHDLGFSPYRMEQIAKMKDLEFLEVA